MTDHLATNGDTEKLQPPLLDVIWGADAIGKVIGRNRQQTFTLLKTGQIPGRKVGNRWVASRSRLLHALVEGDKL